jgi:hypothetical protein
MLMLQTLVGAGQQQHQRVGRQVMLGCYLWMARRWS